MKLATPVSSLPEPYRDALMRGRGPSFDDDVAQAYRERPPSARDPRRQPWKYYAPCVAARALDYFMAVVLTPFAVLAVVMVIGGAYDLVFDASVHDKIRAYAAEGSWGLLVFTAVAGALMVAMVSALVGVVHELYAKLWHTRRHVRARAAGLGHYGIYLSHDHLLLRRPESASRALLVPREQVERIERLERIGRGTHPTTVWRTAVIVNSAEGPIAVDLHDHDFELGKGLEGALREWLEWGLAPRDEPSQQD